MKHRRWLALSLATAGLVALSLALVLAGEGKQKGTEKKVTLAEVPAAVKATILKEAGDNAIKEIEQVTERDVTFYEAEWLAGGQETEIKVAADGKLIGKEVEAAGEEEEDEEGESSEKKLTLDQVPAPVKATILKEAGNNDIKEVEAETEEGQTVYAAEWVVDGHEVEIKVAADGKLLKKKVEVEDKDEDEEGEHEE
jgi:hypothetical protein